MEVLLAAPPAPVAVTFTENPSGTTDPSVINSGNSLNINLSWTLSGAAWNWVGPADWRLTVFPEVRGLNEMPNPTPVTTPHTGVGPYSLPISLDTGTYPALAGSGVIVGVLLELVHTGSGNVIACAYQESTPFFFAAP